MKGFRALLVIALGGVSAACGAKTNLEGFGVPNDTAGAAGVSGTGGFAMAGSPGSGGAGGSGGAAFGGAGGVGGTAATGGTGGMPLPPPPPGRCTQDGKWEEPTVLEIRGGFRPRVFSTDEADAWATWGDQNGIVVARFQRNRGGWGSPERILSCAEACGYSAAFDRAGNGVVGLAPALLARHFDRPSERWSRPEPLAVAPADHNSLCEAGVFGGRSLVTWRAPRSPGSSSDRSRITHGTVQASPGSGWIDTRITSDGGGDQECRVAVSMLPDPTAMFAHTDGMYFHAADARGEWSEVRISRAGAFASEPGIGTDAQGNRIAVWHELVGGFNTPDTVSTAAASFYDAGRRSWSSPTDVENYRNPSEVIEGVRVAMSSNGDAMAVWWNVVERFYAARFDGRQRRWETPQLMFERGVGGSSVGDPDIAMDASGNAFLLREGPAGDIVARAYDVVTRSWGPEERIQGPSMFGSQRPRISASPDGIAFAIWSGPGLNVARRICDL